MSHSAEIINLIQEEEEKRSMNAADQRVSGWKYEDIIDLPHPVSKTHPPMSLLNRAAQFAPFAALTGYEEAVEETARLTDDEIYLDEGEIAALNETLIRLEAALSQHPEVQLTYFQPDAVKSGGAYQTIRGAVKKIDRYKKSLLMESGEEIPMNRLMALEIAG